jgi:5-methylcytosine-specific restriction endonuclease McrA
VPLIIEDNFCEIVREYAIPSRAVSAVTQAASWSARNSRSGLVPATVVALFTDDADQDERSLTAAGIVKRAKKGAWQIIPGCGLTVINACDVEAKAESSAVLATPASPLRCDEKTLRKQASERRRSALFRNKPLKQAICERDADRCRYCDIRVRWGKGRAPDSGTFDHVDPHGPNTMENLVVACCSCNGSKRDRTPEEAGMKLLDPPQTEARHASCHASEDDLNRDTPIDDFDQDLNHLGHGSRSSDAGDGKRDEARGLVGEVIARIFDEWSIVLTAEQAETAIAAVRRRAKKAGTRIRDPKRYIPAAIASEPDIFGLIVPEAPLAADVLAGFSDAPPGDRHAYDHNPTTGACRECEMPRSNTSKHLEEAS